MAGIMGQEQWPSFNDMYKYSETREGRIVTFAPIRRISAKLVLHTGVSGHSPDVVAAAFVCSFRMLDLLRLAATHSRHSTEGCSANNVSRIAWVVCCFLF